MSGVLSDLRACLEESLQKAFSLELFRTPVVVFICFPCLSLLLCLFSTGGKTPVGLGLDDFLTEDTVYSSTGDRREGGRTGRSRRRLLLFPFSSSTTGTTRVEPPYWLQGFTVSSLSGVFGGLGNLSAKALIEIIGSEGIFNCLYRYEFFLSVTLTAVLCGFQLFFLNVALYR